MRKLLIVLLCFVGIAALDIDGAVSQCAKIECNVSDLHNEQIVCALRYNVAAERTSSVVIPSARTIAVSTIRYLHPRHSIVILSDNYQIINNYSVLRFIHRLGNCARAIDYYLYMFCQLRL